MKKIMIIALGMALSACLHANINDKLTDIGTQGETIKQSVSPKLVRDAKKQAARDLKAYQALLGGLRAQKNDEKKGGKPADGALLFVSFSMPDETILAMTAEASRYGIPVVIKGLVAGDFQKTLQKIMQLHEKAKQSGGGFSGFAIDPVWFEQFAIDTVPALVVTRRPPDCLYQKACENQPFDSVLGNVSIRKSLSLIADNGGEVASVARDILEKGHV